MSRPTGTKNKVKKVAIKKPVIEPIDIPITAEAVSTPQEPQEVATNTNNCEYRLTMQFNGETFDCYTNNLKVSILSYGREVLTEMYLTIKKGQADFTKKLTLVQAKMLLKDEQSIDIFLETFYGLYGRPSNLQLK